MIVLISLLLYDRYMTLGIFKKPLIAGVVSLLVAVVTVNAIATFYLIEVHNQDGTMLANLILASVEPLHKPLVSDPQNKRYVPEARLILPADPTNVGQVVYEYTPAADKSPATIQLASVNQISSARSQILSHSNDINQLFNYVPHLQACSRGIRIEIGTTTTDKPDATKTLANGTRLNFYTEADCQNQQLLDYAEQFASY